VGSLPVAGSGGGAQRHTGTSPTTGRWMCEDPLGPAQSDANLYRYVGNRPADRTDPSGLQFVYHGVYDPDCSTMLPRGKAALQCPTTQASPGNSSQARVREIPWTPGGAGFPVPCYQGSSRARKAGGEQQRAMEEYNLALFGYYQRLLQILPLVGDELYTNGMEGLGARFPWLRPGTDKYTDAPGWQRGTDGESALYVQLNPNMAKRPFPINWPRLAQAIRYSMRHYGTLDKWVLANTSSMNPHGLFIGIFPPVLSTEQFYGTPNAALADLIHEPLHDLCMYGGVYPWPGHTVIKDIVPTGGVGGEPKSKYGSDLEQLIDFLDTAEPGNRSLWDRILHQAGPRPHKPANSSRR